MSPDLPEQPVWDEGVAWPSLSPLQGSITADVVVIGGGLTGLLAAYLVGQGGRRVVVLEKNNQLGHGATGVTTAFLVQYLDTDLHELLAIWGRERARAIIAAHGSAIDLAEDIVRREHIACDFERCINYSYATEESDQAGLRREQAAGEKLGLPLAYKTSGLPFAHHGFLELPRQAKFHPLRYMAALANIITERGGRIYTGTAAEAIARAGDDVVVTAGLHTVRAGHAIVATYAPFDQKLFFKKSFYTSYVLCANLPRGAVPAGLYDDMANPYHYWRVDQGDQHDRLIFGGADHRSDIPVKKEKNWQALAEELQRVFAGIPYELHTRWHGPILETVDGLAYIGPAGDERILYATGFSGNGMTYSHIAARIMSDTIEQKSNPWQPLFAARRLPTLKALFYKGQDYTGELLGGAVRNSLRR